MALLILLAMISLSLITSQSMRDSPEGGTVPDFRSLCPNSDMCSFSSKENFTTTHLTSCCQKCSCAKDCHSAGNCCPDILAENETLSAYPCVDVRQLFNKPRGLAFNNFDEVHFRVIDKCPNSSQEQTFPACKSPVELQDHVLVSDKAGLRAFKNRHCAMCNGEQEYVSWRTATTCQEIASVSFKTFAEQNEYILSKCALMSLPPNNEILQMTRCYTSKDVVAACNKTGWWDVYDKQLEQACTGTTVDQRQGYNSLYFRFDTFRQNFDIFANVFCYLCNFPKTYPMNSICPVDTADFDMTKSSMFFKFTAVLDLRSYYHDDGDKKTKCKSTSFFDPYSGICRYLFCPAGSIPDRGRCKSNYLATYGQAMALFFEVNARVKYELGPTILENMHAQLDDFLGQQFGCAKCRLQMFTSQNTSRIFVKFAMITTKNCPPTSLLNMSKKLVTTQFQTQIYDGKNILQIPYRITFEPMKELQEIHVYRRNIFCPDFIPITRIALQNCPRIEISTQEVDALALEHTSAYNETSNQLLFVRNEHTNNISICVETYFHLRKLEKSGQESVYHCESLVRNVILALAVLLRLYL